jgi:hypothetical protein
VQLTGSVSKHYYFHIHLLLFHPQPVKIQQAMSVEEDEQQNDYDGRKTDPSF